jgi:hypothetical protein
MGSLTFSADSAAFQSALKAQRLTSTELNVSSRPKLSANCKPRAIQFARPAKKITTQQCVAPVQTDTIDTTHSQINPSLSITSAFKIAQL